MEVTHRNIDQCNTGAEIGVGILGINKRMLAPISDHETHSHDSQREDQREECCARVDIVVENINHGVVAQFPECGPDGILGLSLSPKVHRKVKPYKKKEPANIAGKVKEAVAVAPHGCAQIIRTISLDVVVFDVVVKVRIPRVSEKRVE